MRWLFYPNFTLIRQKLWIFYLESIPGTVWFFITISRVYFKTSILPIAWITGPMIGHWQLRKASTLFNFPLNRLVEYLPYLHLKSFSAAPDLISKEFKWLFAHLKYGFFVWKTVVRKFTPILSLGSLKRKGKRGKKTELSKCLHF